MERERNDMTPVEAAAALVWLVDMGADEVVQEEAVNRLAPPPAPAQQELSSVAPPAPRGDAASIAAACTSLAEIEQALSRFDACPLKKTATRLCFADGNPRAHVMLIGEAPGREEDELGKPFVGRSGQLLDRMLAAIGLSRAESDPAKSVFITNTIYWRPPGNRTPTETETQMCLPFLMRTIELQKPRFIVCLGATPTQRLLSRNDGILKLRGKWFDFGQPGQVIPLLATLHPAYLLRQPAQKRLAWRDFLALSEVMAKN
ncbi:MAG: uracil-DNA glycosylase [Aestuariivirga sp.]